MSQPPAPAKYPHDATVTRADLVLPPLPVDRDARQRAELAMADHDPCADCVRCGTCRREWCPTVVDRCPGEESWWMHPTGGYGGDDQAYCYRCTRCPGGYFQFHDDAHPACTEVVQEPHVVADGRGWE